MTEEEIKQKFNNNEEIDWMFISENQVLSEDFIREFEKKLFFIEIAMSQKLSEDFMRDFKDILYWIYISHYQQLSEEFIKEFRNFVNWENISVFQKLSEQIIDIFKDKVNWNYISRFQQLSENFIEEYKDYINWHYISCDQNLSEDFLEKYKDYVNIRLYREYHIEKPYYQKLEEVIHFCKCYNLYYDNEYFEAYKKFGLNNKDLSVFNWTQYYKSNFYYKNWRVDCNCNHLNSFGYEISGIKKDNNYKKVKVKIQDWGTSIERKIDVARVKGFMIIE